MRILYLGVKEKENTKGAIKNHKSKSFYQNYGNTNEGTNSNSFQKAT